MVSAMALSIPAMALSIPSLSSTKHLHVRCSQIPCLCLASSGSLLKSTLPTGEALKLFIHTDGPSDRTTPSSSYSVWSQRFSVAADLENSNETSHVSSSVDNSGRKSCSAKTYLRLLRPPGYRKLGWCSLKNRLP